MINILFLLAIPLPIAIVLALVKDPKISILGQISRIFLLISSFINLVYIFKSDESFYFRFTDTGLLGIGLKLDKISASLIFLTAFLFFIYGIFNKGIGKYNSYQEFLILTLESIIFMLFMTQDIFNLFALLEVSTIICGTLIMLLKKNRSVYDGLVYIMINTVGIMFYLMGVGMLYKIFGNLDMEFLMGQITSIDKKNLILPFAFIFTGLSVKSALFPVFLWLPKAHGSKGAPAIVSAILSGVYIKAGVYALIQIAQIFNQAINVSSLLLVLGIITSLIGIILAVFTKDIKLILAYHTVSQIGLIFIGVSGFDKYGYYGGIMHIINHGLFKSLLFLTIGYIYKIYKTRNLKEIKGLWKRSPTAAFALIVGILGITGAPAFNGSISKYMISNSFDNNIMTIVLHIINFGTCLSFVKLGSILFGDSQKKETTNFYIKSSLILLELAVFLTGIFGLDIYEFFSGNSYEISILAWLEKILVWAIYIGLAIFTFKNILPKVKLYNRGLDIDFEFNTIVFLILILFAIYTSYAFIVTI